MPKYKVRLTDVIFEMDTSADDAETAYQNFIDYYIEFFKKSKVDIEFTTSIKVYDKNGQLAFDEDTPIDHEF